ALVNPWGTAWSHLIAEDFNRSGSFKDYAHIISQAAEDHPDEHKSFSVFQSKNGKGWQWKCFAGCENGDEIASLVKHFNISRREAIKRYLNLAGFPPCRPPKSREYPKSHVSPECPVFPVYPVSEGQAVDGELERRLKALAAQ